MKLKKLFSLVIIFMIAGLLNTCKKDSGEPTKSLINNDPINSSSVPYIKPPSIYLPMDFNRMMCGITVIDTIIKDPPNSWKAKIVSMSGDTEEISLGMIIGTFTEGLFGLGCEIPIEFTDGSLGKNNGTLEVNRDIDKLTLTYISFNNKEQTTYSIAISDSMIFYPQRWKDRAP